MITIREDAASAKYLAAEMKRLYNYLLSETGTGPGHVMLKPKLSRDQLILIMTALEDCFSELELAE